MFTNDFWEILSQLDFFELLLRGWGVEKNLKTREKNLKLAGNLDLYTFVTAKVPEICAHVSSESWTSKNIQYLNLVDKIRMVTAKCCVASSVTVTSWTNVYLVSTSEFWTWNIDYSPSDGISEQYQSPSYFPRHLRMKTECFQHKISNFDTISYFLAGFSDIFTTPNRAQKFEKIELGKKIGGNR